MNFLKVAVFLSLLMFTCSITMAALTDGLVAYWPLDSNTKDAVGDHDGILGGDAKLIDDPERGKVLDVSANNGAAYMEVAHEDDIGFVDSATRTFTISLWAKPANLPRTGWTTVFAKNRPLSPDETIYGMWINGSNTWHFRVAEATNNGIVATGDWQHLVLRHEAGVNMHGFINGQQVLQRGTGTGNVGDIELIIGCADKNGFEPYPGLIDDFAIYDRPLGDDEIKELAEGAIITSQRAVEPASKLAATWGELKR